MNLLKTFTKYATGSMGALLAGLLTTPILTRLISTSQMGKYSMFITIGGLLASILYLGLDQSYVRFYNEELPGNRNYLLQRCLSYPLIVTSICAIAIHLLYRTVSDVIIGEKSLLIASIFSIYLLALVIDRFWLLKLRMEQKAGVYSILNILRKLSYLFIAVLLYFTVLGDSGWTLIIAVTLAEFVLLIGIRLADKGQWGIKKKELRTSKEELMKYGFPFIFSTTITLLFQSTDKLMLKALSDFNQIGIYSGASNIVNLITQVQLVFSTFWMPVAFEHFSKAPNDKKFFIRINKIISYCMLVISIIVLCLKDVVILFLGAKYKEAVYVFPFLAFMPIMYTVSESTVMGINFKKKTNYHVIISVICASVNAIGNYELIMRFGAKGAALSTGLSYLLFFLLRTYFANRVYPIKFAIARYFISCTMVYILAIIASFHKTNSIFIIFSVGVLCVITILYRDILKDIFDALSIIMKKRFVKQC
ncbi:lipopolysaccharide biosynthesis protein [Eisenbergiella sp.]